MPTRDPSLDALRGLSILGMVLSGSIAFGDVLPAWMFHAQVPPPLHKFDPSRAGITWVDLVFPFFLFAMGAAIPLALQSLTSSAAMARVALRRFALLLWLAMFSQHMKASSIAAAPDPTAQALAIAGFVLLGLQFGGGPRGLRWAGWATAIVLMAILPFKDGRGFDPVRSDIILVVLANMALFATPIWWFTRDRPLLRLGLLPPLAAVLIGGSVAGSWNAWLFAAAPLPWATKFLFLKYLFIVLPATFVGEWLLREREDGAAAAVAPATAWLCAALIVGNVSLLFARELTANLVLSSLLSAWLLARSRHAAPFVRRCVQGGVWLLALGLASEALEGGIRKDASTFSYYFVTGALAILSLLVLRALAASRLVRGIVAMLATQGRNPLLAYVAGALLVLPLLHLMGLHPVWSALNQGPWIGLFKGLVFTAAVAAIAAWATRRGWVWKA